MIMRVNIFKSILILLLIFNLSVAPNSFALSENEGVAVAKAVSSAFKGVVKKITPALVHISPVKKVEVGQNPFDSLPENHPFRHFFGDNFIPKQAPNQRGRSFKEQQGLGTGFIIDTDGHILTNNHVIAGADEVKVTLADKRKFDAEVVGLDPRSDLAVIRIKASELKPLELGDSDKLDMGEWVIAAGNPFGFDNSYTAGIVSGKGRSLMRGTQYEDFIQTDAAINPGNSGGPLVNLDGKVVGINTAIFTRSGGYMGLGFAIPVNMAKSVVKSLIEDGKVTRGWLGVAIQNLTEDLADSFNFDEVKGALVGDVTADSPAGKGGMKSGDIITKYGNKDVNNVEKLRNLVAMTKPGKRVKIKIYRNGEFKTLKIKIGELKQEVSRVIESEEYAEDIGLKVEDINKEIMRDFDLNTETGVAVTNVDQYGLAAQVGIRPGDVILKAAGKKLNSAKQFYKLIKKADLKKGIRLVIESNGMKRFVFLKNE